MTPPCDCCQGEGTSTPLDRRNRPGLSTIVYRVGTYASFFETMKARLSGLGLGPGSSPLRALTTRDGDDPAIAWLDACAVVADVLTFYQERIATEAYLRTATERRSVLELAALVGYALRPGVAASTYLAYTLDGTSRTSIPAGTPAQSVAGPGELPQTFETAADFDAVGAFSNLAPRMSRPQVLAPETSELYVAGVSTNLNPNDPLLVIASPPRAAWIASATVQPQENRTKIVLQAAGTPPPQPPPPPPAPPFDVGSLIGPLAKPPAPRPASSRDLPRRAADVFDLKADTAPKLIQALHPEMQGQLYAALRNANVTPAPAGQAHAFRVRSAVFGHNAQQRSITDEKGIVIGTEEWPLGPGLSVFVHMPFGSRSIRNVGVTTTPASPPSVIVRVSQGTTRGSATLTLDGDHGTKEGDAGKWPVRATIEESHTFNVRVEFPTLKRTYTVVADARDLITLTFDGGEMVATFGKTATLDAEGRHTLLLITEHGLLVTDDSAMAPESRNIIDLDGVYDRIVKGSYVVVARTDAGHKAPLVTKVTDAAQVSLSSYGLSLRVTRLTLKDDWLTDKDVSLAVARGTTVYAQSEPLELAAEPLLDDVSEDLIELGDLYEGIDPGRWVIVQGERTDVLGAAGIVAAELMMVAGIEQREQQTPAVPASASAPAAGPHDRPGETRHSFLRLSSHLAYRYKRSSVTIYGNVVRATHGETRREVLGSGDGGKALQRFTLHVSTLTPLTYVSAPTVDGIASTLQVFVNGVQWREVDSLAGAGPLDRCYATSADNDEKVTITFGDGQHGMRLPSGPENVRATYRVGLGSGANVPRARVSMLTNKPFGVRAVINPLPASGGGDRDTRDEARRNAPTAAIALNRLVSVQDYADFARTYGGVGKATAALGSDGHRETVFVTIAGAAGSLIDATSDLPEHLVESFRQYGDPHVPVAIGICQFRFLVIAARVKVLPGYRWKSIASLIEAELRKRFGFDRQELGEPVFLSTVIATIQHVPGVAYVKVDTLDSITADDVADARALRAKFAALASASAPNATVGGRSDRKRGHPDASQPAELVFLNPAAPETLRLAEITS